MDSTLRNEPLISVIIPVYNSANYIAETIDSVLNQTHSNWEVINVDDGSTDTSKEIIFDFCKKDNRIKYTHQQNKGQAAARNTGVKNARGEFIAFLDSDDIWHPEKLTLQLEYLRSKNVDVVFSDSEVFPKQYDIGENHFTQKGFLKGEQFFIELFQKSSITNSSVLLKKSIFNKVGFFDEDPHLRGTEDWDMWLRMANAGYSFYGIDKKLVKYRIHEGGIHLNYLRMYAGKIAIMDKYRLSKTIPNQLKLKQYRYFYRELINHAFTSGNEDKIPMLIFDLKKRDKYGIATNLQNILIGYISIKNFQIISNKLIYRIFYRLERIFL